LGGDTNREIEFGFGSCRACRAGGRGEAAWERECGDFLPTLGLGEAICTGVLRSPWRGRCWAGARCPVPGARCCRVVPGVGCQVPGEIGVKKIAALRAGKM